MIFLTLDSLKTLIYKAQRLEIQIREINKRKLFRFLKIIEFIL